MKLGLFTLSLFLLFIQTISFGQFDGTKHHMHLPDGYANSQYDYSATWIYNNANVEVISNGNMPAGFNVNTSGDFSLTFSNPGAYEYVFRQNTDTITAHIHIHPELGEVYDEMDFYDLGPYATSVVQETFNIPSSVFSFDPQASGVVSFPSTANNSNVVSPGAFPVIALMHGNGYEGSAWYTQFMRHLSSWGYIVTNIWRPDNATGTGWVNSQWVPYQIEGYQHLIDLNDSTTSIFYQHIDTARIGLMGHSWGGATTQANMFRSEARAFVLLDIISMLQNSTEWNNIDNNYFSQAAMFPEQPVLIVDMECNAALSNPSAFCPSFTYGSMENTGAYSGPHYQLSLKGTGHTTIMDDTFPQNAADAQLIENTVSTVSHYVVSFFNKYVKDSLNNGFNLYGSDANETTLTQFPERLVNSFYRPTVGGQLLIDDFGDLDSSVNNLGLGVLVSNDESHYTGPISLIEDNSLINNFLPLSQQVVNDTTYKFMKIRTVNPASLVENLGTPSNPLDVNNYTHLAFDISLIDTIYQYADSIPVNVSLKDFYGDSIIVPISAGLGEMGIASDVFHQTALISMKNFDQLALDSLISLGIYYAPDDTAQIELDDIRFERLACYVTGTDVVTACGSYTWIDGNTYTMNNNTATYTLKYGAVNGCDSIVTLNLTMITGSVNTATTVNGLTISSDASGATYQWLDCDNGWSVIAGATNQDYTATANGSYAVEVTENGCVDTSACVSITTVGIFENSLANQVRLFPNPTEGNFAITFDQVQESLEVRLLTLSGQLLEVKEVEGTDIVQMNMRHPRGVYLVEIVANEGDKAVFRLVKE